MPYDMLALVATTTDPAAAALAELDRLSRSLTAAETVVHTARASLQEAVIRHLRERSASPSDVAAHTPYDRNWVRVLAREAGVPPLKQPGVKRAPLVYDGETRKAALAELDKLTDAFTAAERKLEKARRPLHAAIARHYLSRIVRPRVLVEHVPYDRGTIYAIVKAAKAAEAATLDG